MGENFPKLLEINRYYRLLLSETVIIMFGIMCCEYSRVSVWTGDDAAKAVTYGVDGILVSNHGARQLDGVPATVGYEIWNLTRRIE